MDKTKKELCALKESVAAIVREAALMIKNVDFTTMSKSGVTDILTTSDLASQRYLIKKLAELIPNSGFYCEEDGISELNREYVWIIDPIDGTTNYSRGIDECAISVALLHNGEAVLGVVGSVFSGDIYSAVLGGGAFLNGQAISVSANSFSQALFCTAMSLYRKEYAEVCGRIIFDTYLKCNDVRRFGSCALELCYIAAGRCELYFEIRVFPWDYAAGYLILREAGGIIQGLADNALNFDGPSVVVAANSRENYERLSQIVNKHLKNIPYED